MPAIVVATAPGLVEQGVGGHHPRHQAAAFGLLGVDGAAGEDQVHRLGLADRAGQPLRAAHAGQHAELDLGLTELRGVGGDQQVAHHRQLTAAAERVARDRRDGGCAGGGELGPRREEVGGENVCERQFGHLLDVRARREGLLVAGDDDRADARIVVEFGCGRGDFVHHLTVERIERLGPVQRDGADAVVTGDQDGLVAR